MSTDGFNHHFTDARLNYLQVKSDQLTTYSRSHELSLIKGLIFRGVGDICAYSFISHKHNSSTQLDLSLPISSNPQSDHQRYTIPSDTWISSPYPNVSSLVLFGFC